MAKMETSGKQFTKAAVLVDEQRVFIITDAKFRESNDEAFADQVVYDIQYLGGEEAKFSMSINDARRGHISHFEEGDAEPFDGINDTNGLVLFKGKGKKGNPPFLFRDATEVEIDAEHERTAEQSALADGDIPF